MPASDGASTLSGRRTLRNAGHGGGRHEDIEMNRTVPRATAVVQAIVPGGDAVETVHIGPYETLGDTYQDMAEWRERRGCRPADVSWESHLTDADDPASREILVAWPIAEDDRASVNRS